MKINKTGILWIICIILYILNIVIVAITGADLVNNIVAWSICLMLATTITLIEESSNLDRETLEAHLDTLPKIRVVQSLMKLHEIREKLKDNEEAIKIIDAEIEELEKELKE